jgi:AP-4 complex subunit epsilon-1
MQVDKNLSFLNDYIQQSIESGAMPYISENERSGMVNMSNFRSHDQQESGQHGLKFEAYEVPKAPVPSKVTPVSLSSTTDLVPVPESLYARETHQISSVGLASDTGSSELKLRLDGVQKKWGKPTYSSPASSSSNSTSQNPVNGVAKVDVATTINSRARDSYDSRKQQNEIDPEKQKLAASLFGGSTKTERRTSTSSKVPKASAADRPQDSKAASVPNKASGEKTNQVQQPPPQDLLDFGEPTVTAAPPTVDPFMQLEGLLDPSVSSTVSHSGGTVANAPDIMGLYSGTTSEQSGGGGYIPASGDNLNLLSELSNAAAVRGTTGETIVSPLSQSVKGANAKDSLEKDAKVRQMGVTPTSQNPNLFRDLLG